MIKFLTIARVLYDKGFKELTECASYFKGACTDIEFSWLGDIDEQYPQFVHKNEVMMLHDQGIINYLGFHKDVRKYIHDADCIILPSYHEGMSRVLMEALALSKPIITSNISGCKETVKEGINGFLCEPRNTESLIYAVKRFLVLSDIERKEMGKQSFIYAKERFDVRDVIRVYDSILNSIIIADPQN